MIRLTRIVYAFRNHVWPKPMEGLDLFSLNIAYESSEGSFSVMESDGAAQSDSDFEVTSPKRRAVTSHASGRESMGRTGEGGRGGGGERL